MKQDDVIVTVIFLTVVVAMLVIGAVEFMQEETKRYEICLKETHDVKACYASTRI